ncbi:MAG: hypothetical protein MI919_36275, partial [Holophagales bacterium]|nr:hypothetical protein [Holophagales bacterium]
GGTFTFVDHGDEVEREMRSLFAKIEHPVLRDIEVMWSDPEVESSTDRLPDLYRGEPLVLLARSPGNLRQVRVRGYLGYSPWEEELTLDGGTTADRSGAELGLHKLWARDRIARLRDRRIEGMDAEEIRRRVVELGIEHHLVTRHTSLVAVDRTPHRPEGEGLRSAPLPVETPAGWVPPGSVLPRGGTACRLASLAGLLLLLAAALLSCRGARA